MLRVFDLPPFATCFSACRVRRYNTDVVSGLSGYADASRARVGSLHSLRFADSAPPSLRAAQRRGNPVARLDCFAQFILRDTAGGVEGLAITGGAR
jgi:hypothetical protein